MQQLNDIWIKQDVTLNDFTRTRIGTGRSHWILYRSGNHSVAAITNIIRIKVRIILRIVFRYNRILKSYFLKRNLPVFYSFLYVISPLVGDSSINVIYNRLLRFHQLTLLITFQVFWFWLQIPSVDVSKFLQTIFLFSIKPLAFIKITDTRVSITRTHNFLRQQNNITRHGYSERSSVNSITHQRLDVYIQRKTLHSQNSRFGRSKTSLQCFSLHQYIHYIFRTKRAEFGYIRYEKRTHIDDICWRVRWKTFYLICFPNRVWEVALKSSIHIGSGVTQIAHHLFVHVDFLFICRESYQYRIAWHLSGSYIFIVTGTRYSGRNHKIASHQVFRNFEIILILNDVYLKHAINRLGSFQ